MTTPMPSEDLPQPADKGTPHGMVLSCPHCRKRAYIRTSRPVSDTYREAWAICTGCGFTGKAHVAWDAEAAPSLQPNPRVSLPRMPYRDAVDEFLSADLATRDQLDMFANTG